MEQCPKCSSFMNFHMVYSCGSPYIYYVCPSCGYDTRNQRTYATTSTRMTYHNPIFDTCVHSYDEEGDDD